MLRNKIIISLSFLWLFPILLYLVLRLIRLDLEPYIFVKNNFYITHFFMICYVVFIVLLISFFSYTIGEFKKILIRVFFSGILFGFMQALMTTLPVTSFFASIIVNNSKNKYFEDIYLIKDRRIPRYSKYDAISLLDQQQYTFQMPARFGPQDDLTEGTTVKLKGVEGKLGRVITSYEVVKPAPAKN